MAYEIKPRDARKKTGAHLDFASVEVGRLWPSRPVGIDDLLLVLAQLTFDGVGSSVDGGVHVMSGFLGAENSPLDREHDLDFLVLLDGRVFVHIERHVAASDLPADL